jgi:hypothetical protein
MTLAIATKTLALLSMLHEPAHRNSASRAFHGRRVLEWTIARLARCPAIDELAIVCWDDQLAQASACVPGDDRLPKVMPRSAGMRAPDLNMQSIDAALRWHDGWRGGLFGATEFDRGFDPKVARQVAMESGATQVLLINPAAAFVDVDLVGQLARRLSEKPELGMCFTPALPGAGAMIVSIERLAELGEQKTFPGRTLVYQPDRPGIDPIGKESSVTPATPIARSTRRLLLDSDRQVAEIGAALEPRAGEWSGIAVVDLIGRMNGSARSATPRDVVIELTTRRQTTPIWSPCKLVATQRPDMTFDRARRILDELSLIDDVRVTFAGVGDPLLNPQIGQILSHARQAGIRALHVATDLLCDESSICEMVQARVDVVSVHLPALMPQTYATLMGVDGLTKAMSNLKRLAVERVRQGVGVPLIVPTMVKCEQNLGEMEAWYDQWLRAVGSAVVIGPGDFGGLIPYVGVSDMTPSRRVPCRRLQKRMTILSDGRTASCEEDATGSQAADVDGVVTAWSRRLRVLADDHVAGDWAKHPVCSSCRMWDRP